MGGRSDLSRGECSREGRRGGAELKLNGEPQAGSQGGQAAPRTTLMCPGRGAGVTAVKAGLEDRKMHFGEKLDTWPRDRDRRRRGLLKAGQGKRRQRGRTAIRDQTLASRPPPLTGSSHSWDWPRPERVAVTPRQCAGSGCLSPAPRPLPCAGRPAPTGMPAQGPPARLPLLPRSPNS